MAKRKFRIVLRGEAVVELDDQVIDVVDDEWRSHLYNLRTPEEIAEHVAYNLICNKWPLSTLNGWADQPDSNARIIGDVDWDDDWDIEEITDEDIQEGTSDG